MRRKFFAIFLAALLASLSITVAVSQPNGTGSLEVCMQEAGNYIYSPKPDLAPVAQACRRSELADQAPGEHSGSDEFLSALSEIRGRFSAFTQEELKECHAVWLADWAQAHDLVYSDEMGIEDFRAAIRELPGNLNAIERDLIDRSYLEQAMSHLAMTRYGLPFSYDGASCSYLGFDIALARIDNVAFLRTNEIAKKYMAGRLSAATYRALWFIVQHADEVPELQADWLERFKATYREFGFPELLVNSLEERVNLAKQRKF